MSVCHWGYCGRQSEINNIHCCHLIWEGVLTNPTNPFIHRVGKWFLGVFAPPSLQDWDEEGIQNFNSSSPDPNTLSQYAVDFGLYVWASVYVGSFPNKQAWGLCWFPRQALPVRGLGYQPAAQWASNSIAGEVQLGWKQRQQYTFFCCFVFNCFHLYIWSIFLKNTSLCRCSLVDFLSS